MTITAEESTPAPASTEIDKYAKEEIPEGAIVITGKPRKPANVHLVGKNYRALPMKSLAAVDLGRKFKAAGEDVDLILSELESWISMIFGRKVAPQIIARLSDPRDELDLPDIMDLIKALTNKATSNPTL